MLSREQMLKKLHLRDEYYRRRARQSFAEFIRYTKPDYQLGWFHEELASGLDQFLDDVLEKRSPRLIVNVPPQEGKSEQVSRRFPAYALGRDSDLRVVACSYSATLALQFSRDVQLIMDEPNYARLFPESIIPGIATKHNAAVRQSDHFELVRHRGSYRCAGIQGSIAGFPVDVLIVDDPYKDHLEARSLVVRENVWNNFVSVLLPRLQQGGGVLICCTRWHQDDLIGRLLEREPDRWKVLSYPAIAEQHEPHRAKGEPLSPRFSLESRLEHKERVGEYLWSALFQQKPISKTDNLLKRYKWRYWQHPEMNLPPVAMQNDKGERFEIAVSCPQSSNRQIQSWDLSFEREARSDYVAGSHVGTSGAVVICRFRYSSLILSNRFSISFIRFSIRLIRLNRNSTHTQTKLPSTIISMVSSVVIPMLFMPHPRCFNCPNDSTSTAVRLYSTNCERTKAVFLGAEVKRVLPVQRISFIGAVS